MLYFIMHIHYTAYYIFRGMLKLLMQFIYFFLTEIEYLHGIIYNTTAVRISYILHFWQNNIKLCAGILIFCYSLSCSHAVLYNEFCSLFII